MVSRHDRDERESNFTDSVTTETASLGVISVMGTKKLDLRFFENVDNQKIVSISLGGGGVHHRFNGLVLFTHKPK